MRTRNTTPWKHFFNYLRYSGIWVTFIGNPFHWDFSFVVVRKDEVSGHDMIDAHLLFVNIRILIDDGDW